MTDNYQIYLPHVSGGQTPEPPPLIDMLPHMSAPPDVLFEMTLIDRDGRQHTARHQCQYELNTDGLMHWYLTKGGPDNAEYEEFYADMFGPGHDQYVCRAVDTSPGGGLFYRLEDIDLDGPTRSRWCPRHWRPGDIYRRAPYVRWQRKDNCRQVNWGQQITWLRFAAYHERYEVAAGVVFNGVAELHWLLNDRPDAKPHERYWYAKGFGLVRWIGEFGYSYVTEIHEPGARPDNTREVIPCLNQ